MDDAIENEARARHDRHIDHPTHRPLSPGYESVGLYGEAEFARVFGGNVDLVPRPGGDRGKDFILRLIIDDDPVMVPIDVKTARKPGNLIVERGKIKRGTIYVLAGFNNASKAAHLIGWEWSAALLRAPVKDFGYGVYNHYIPRYRLQTIASLVARLG